MGKEIISFDNVSFSYNGDLLVIDNVSFSIYENEYICIIGHNGSGKSTLSKLLTSLVKPSKGTIKLYNQVITKDNIDYLRNKIGVIFQNPDSQFIGITAEDDIAFGLENRQIPREKMKEIIDEAADKINVKDLLKFESQKLSGGQKQRIAIAGILAINPDIIIFDESTSMLDPKGKMELKQMMIDLKEKEGKTIISITHDMDEVINATRVLVMNKGKVEKFDIPEKIFMDKKYLQSIHLDVPFDLKLSELLNNKFKNIKPTLNNEELMRSICKTIK